MLRVALPNKGRMAEEARALFADAGLEVRPSSDRSLIAAVSDDLEVIFARSQDIPEFVADGAADCGVTGRDLVLESSRPLADRLDLGFGRCRLVFAVRDDSPIEAAAQVDGTVRVATAFPRLTERFFAEQGRGVQLVPVSGAAEITPHLGIADAIVDLVSTGSTLRTNGLRELATILDSTARLVTRDPVAPSQAGELDALVARLDSVVRARGQRYLMANVPRASLGRIKEVVPGIDGPTVMDVLDGGAHVAVHAVVAAAKIDATIRGLKSLGATGVLVTRIERLVP
ncbi:MAG: ATP phosphoribosyltransferase [Gemmatimonadetes bacterium]|nr:ATP phosphoribosyltransferase [Gemmatimonadota bacterium]